MIVGDLAAAELVRRLRGPGLAVRTGAFALRLRSDVPAVAAGMELLYAEYPLLEDDEFCDYAIDVERARGLRGWVRPQVNFAYDAERMFESLPLAHAMPLVEWAWNWCIGSHAHQYVVLHAACVEREGLAAILPAPPGSGKSTLCAALVGRGWRLLSDELTLVELGSGLLRPIARPISLKNRSIDIIARYVPEAVFGAPTHDTAKGTVAHLRAPAADIRRADEPAHPAWVVFPRYAAGAAPTLAPRDKAEAMLELVRNTFNSGVASRQGFHALADLVGACDCHDFAYSALDDAVATFDGLVRRRRA